MKNKIGTINLTPTWDSVFNMFVRGLLRFEHLDEILRPAIILADEILSAQQSGKTSITFTFVGKETLVTTVPEEEGE